MKTLEKTVEEIKFHLSAATAMVSETSPIFAVYETGIAGMSYETSLHARLLAVGMIYGGFGFVYEKGRTLFRKMLKVKDDASEKIQGRVDSLYGLSFNILIGPPIYYICGAKNFKEIAIGTACSAIIGAVNGFPLGWTIDAYQDLTGLKECERKSYPDLIKKQKPEIKKTIAVGLTAASIGITGLIYYAKTNL
jgi:hypothetical protein